MNSALSTQPIDVQAAEGTRQAVLAGLIGRGIQLSRSPAMHEAEGTAQGLNYQYRLFDTDRMSAPERPLDEILRAAEICGFAGLNVTYPYKIDVIEHLDSLSDAATAVGAVNTVVFRNGKRTGHNTDLWGFAESFRRNMAGVERNNVLQIGAGGAGAAVGHALMECGIGKLWVTDSDFAKAESLVERLCAKHGPERAEAVRDFRTGIACRIDGVVNATPVGMASVPGTSFPGELIEPRMWVADIVYFPLETELLRIARQKGCRTLPGSGMAVYQAVRAFEHFTGRTPDSERMEAAFNAFETPVPG